MEANQSVRMEELLSRINFSLLPLQIGWRMEWISRSGRVGAMEVGSGGEWRKKRKGGGRGCLPCGPTLG